MTIPDEVDIIVCGGGSCGYETVPSLWLSSDSQFLAALWQAVWPTWTTTSRSCSLKPAKATSTTLG